VGGGTFYTVVVDGTVMDSHETVDSDEAALERAIASAEALARGGETAEVFRNEVAGEIGRPEPQLVQIGRAHV